ncbi:MAG: response regulator transcription factor, partial [Anaerolineaceae bacterium]|nr:response regulator transcription factor [Anaerolineaceae bacterium]
MIKQRILLVDDHEVVRLGLKALLEHHPHFEVIAEASSAKEALEQTGSHRPDIVLMDIRLPGTSGIEACELIIRDYPETKVVMLTSYAEDEMLFSAIRAGASGYVLKQIGGDDLIRALESVGRGEALLDPAVTQRVFQEVRRAVKEEEASAFANLSQQEKHV